MGIYKSQNQGSWPPKPDTRGRYKMFGWRNMHFRPKKSRYTAILLFGLLAYLANRSTVCLRGGGLRKLSFGENWLTGALIALGLSLIAINTQPTLIKSFWPIYSKKTAQNDPKLPLWPSASLEAPKWLINLDQGLIPPGHTWDNVFGRFPGSGKASGGRHRPPKWPKIAKNGQSDLFEP